MERLTRKNSMGVSVLNVPVVCQRCNEHEYNPSNGERELAAVISAYEDTKLAPAEITALKSENERLRAERDKAVEALNEKCRECGFFSDWRKCVNCSIFEFRVKDKEQ